MRELIVTMLALTTVLAAPQTAAADGWEALTFKVTASGALDTSYGDLLPNGTRTGKTRPLIAGDEMNTAIVQNTNGMYITGGSYTDAARSTRNIVITQRWPDSRLDQSFGYLGVTTAEMPGTHYGHVAALALDDEDRILALINAEWTQATQLSTRTTYLARFKANGALDSTFGQSGYARLSGLATYNAYGVDLVYNETNDQILVSVEDNASPAIFWGVIRLTRDGQIDTTFHNGGMLTPALEAGTRRLRALAVDQTGRVIIVGENALGTVGIMRLLTTGAIDQAFGGADGIRIGTATTLPLAVAVDSYYRVVIAGAQYNNGVQVGFIARVRSDGVIDNTFNGNGWKTFAPGTGLGGGFTDVAVSLIGDITASGTAVPTAGGLRQLFVVRCGGYGNANPFGSHLYNFGDTFEDFRLHSGHFVLSGDRIVIVGTAERVGSYQQIP